MSRTDSAEGLPRIDVLMPVFNGERFLADQIDSILGQEGVDLRLIVLDDASTDQSREVLEEVARRDPRVEVRISPQNRGLIRSVGALLAMVEAPYFALSDQDDVWDPTKLSISVRHLEDAAAALVYSDVRIIDAAGEVLSTSYLSSRRIAIPTGSDPLPYVFRNPAIGHTIVGRSQVAHDAAAIPEDLTFHEAWIVAVAMARGNVVGIPRQLGSYRDHGSNVVGPSASGGLASRLGVLGDRSAILRRWRTRAAALSAVASVAPRYAAVARAYGGLSGSGRLSRTGVLLRLLLHLARTIGIRAALTEAGTLVLVGRARRDEGDVGRALAGAQPRPPGAEGRMRVAFVLPGIARAPIGGYRVVYEVANRLAAHGHEVHLLHLRSDHLRPVHGPRRWAIALKYFALRATPPAWFDLHPAVRVESRPSSRSAWIPPVDVVVATSVATADLVAEVKAERGVRGVYLIQHFEDFSVDAAEVVRTWRLPLERVVVSEWLRLKAEEAGVEADLAVNGIDLELFSPGPDDARSVDVLAMVSDQTWKRTDLVVELFAKLVEKDPDLRLATFGTIERPVDLPASVRHHHLPSRRELAILYQRSRLFVCLSDFEGFGLPALEAAACGARILTTENGGVPSFASDFAWVVPRGDIDAIFDGARTILSGPTDVAAVERGLAVAAQHSDDAALASLAAAILGTRAAG